jgi:hypothetical protein
MYLCSIDSECGMLRLEGGFLVQYHIGNQFTPLSTPLQSSSPRPIPLDIPPHLRKRVEELFVYRPILQIAVISLEQRTRVMRTTVLVEEESVFKGKGPVEAQIARVAAGEISGLEDCGVVGQEARAKRGPGEEVKGDGVSS